MLRPFPEEATMTHATSTQSIERLIPRMTRAARIASAAALSLAASVASAPAEDWMSPLTGGEGGSRVVAQCAPTQYMIGANFRVGNYVDAIQPLCEQRPGARDAGYYTSVPHQIGGNGGAPGRVMCPPESPVVVSMYIMAQAQEGNTIYVHQVVLYCDKLFARDRRADAYKPDLKIYGANVTAPRLEGRPACPASMAGTGFHGFSGLYVDRLGLICGTAPLTDDLVCNQYAAVALDQVATNQAKGCGYSGPRWSTNQDQHWGYCRYFPQEASAAERAARDEDIAACEARIAAQPPPTGYDPRRKIDVTPPSTSATSVPNQKIDPRSPVDATRVRRSRIDPNKPADPRLPR
jgi:hypothetical protein